MADPDLFADSFTASQKLLSSFGLTTRETLHEIEIEFTKMPHLCSRQL